MVKYLLLKMLRDIRRSFSAYGVAAAIVALGFAGYSVLSIAVDQLEESRKYFFDKSSFCDAFAEVQQAPISVVRELEKIEGVRRAEGRIVKDAQVKGMEKDTELKLISYNKGGLNIPLLSRGMLSEMGTRQIVLGEGFLKAHKINEGDTIAVTVGGIDTTYTVTGSGLSPENIYLVKNINEILPTHETYDAAFLNYTEMARLYSLQGRANNFAFELEDGIEIDDVKDDIEAVLKPYGVYSVYDSDDELSVSVLQMEIEQVGKVTKVIPIMFLGISAVILYITLNRLIEQQRTQIGTLMALGVSSKGIALHYTAYGAIVGLLGGLFGGIYGSLSGGYLADFYRMYFSLPDVSVPISPKYMLIGVVVATVFCAVVGGISVRGAVTLEPAQALRPAPPKAARKFFLEKIPRFTELFTVPGIMAVRNIARNPRRSMLSFLGIACAYIITATLVSMNTMFDVFLFDYLEKNQRQDITVSFNRPIDTADAMRAVRSEGIEIAEGITEIPVKIKGRADEINCVAQGISETAQLSRLYSEDDVPIYVKPEGIVLSVHMAGQLGVKAGDIVELEVSYPNKKTTRVIVSDLFAQYLGNNVYMSREQLGKVSEYRNSYTSILIKAPQAIREELLDNLKDSPVVATVKSRQEKVDQYRGMMGNLGAMMAMLAAMGVVIGFAIIYTGSLIGYEELKREISVMRMLGLSDKQCMEAVSVSQWILTSGAVIIGIPMTIGMSKIISKTMAMEMFSIPDFVDATSLLVSIGLISIAVIWSNATVYRKLRKIMPVELLRERE